jgi:hypothetical protein
MNKGSLQNSESLFERISEILELARRKVYRAANTEMLYAYWNVGREIVVEEQNGKDRAQYGRALIKDLSFRLKNEYGKGFTETNLKYMRQFYQVFASKYQLYLPTAKQLEQEIQREREQIDLEKRLSIDQKPQCSKVTIALECTCIMLILLWFSIQYTVNE